MKKFFIILVSLIFLLLIIISINTILFKSKQYGSIGKRKTYPVDVIAVSHLSSAIKYRTISFDKPQDVPIVDSLLSIPGWNTLPDVATSGFDSLLSFLRRTYPLTYSKIEVRTVNMHSLLFKWKGKDSSKKPVILYAHMDVVPAEEGQRTSWDHPAFSGIADDNFIYGRGAIDDKGSVIAILESSEKLLKNGFTPSRDIYFAFGHDEETGGEQGAKILAGILKKDGVNAEFLLDEGGLIAVDMVPFVKPPVALIATAEKGYMSLQLTVRGTGGHSSFPPKEPPVEILAVAIKKIHDNAFDERMTSSMNNFLDYAGAEMQLPYKALFANRWLFRSVIFGEYRKIASGNAMIRTTSVTTLIEGGVKENVIPSEVTATVNFRLLPGDNSKQVFEDVKKIIADERIEVLLRKSADEPSPESSIESNGFRILEKTIRNVYPDVIVAPSLLIGQTDSRHFTGVAENIYRFLPVRMNSKVLDSMHGANEKTGIADFMESVEFYRELLSVL